MRKSCAKVWPINESASGAPSGWTGWPENKKFALVLTHDVDTKGGQDKCAHLAEMEEELGFRSCFSFVPKRYPVSSELRERLTRNGFEVGVHGLYHDGKLYRSRQIFRERADQINRYIQEWGACGFRSPAMHHQLDWLHDLNIEYDSSTFDTDPFEPQPDGTETIFPFFVAGNSNQKGYVELPYTIPQDSTLFVFMNERTIDIWKRKLDWVARHGGMALFLTHPDYMNFEGKEAGLEKYPANYYQEILQYIKSRYEGQYWHALPKEMARFWVKRMKRRMNSCRGTACRAPT